jgi:methionine--tRNA ligase beta chain
VAKAKYYATLVKFPQGSFMTISYNDFKKLDMRVGKIISAEKVPKTEKLYRIIVDIGEKKIKTISSLADYYTADELVGKKVIILVNLEPAKFCGELSDGMLLCAEKDGKCILLSPEKDIEEGAHVT